MDTLLYQVALTLLPGVGDVLAKNLVSYCGSPEAVFRAPKTKLLKVPGIGTKTAASIAGQGVLDRAREEIEFINKKRIRTFFFHEDGYPQRLVHCADSPVLLYGLGDFEMNAPKIVGIVGTRHMSAYGKAVVQQVVSDLAPYKPVIVSGLAYGVDIAAHKAAVKENLSTVAVLAHGLDRVYPGVHKDTARKMVQYGGLITEYPSRTNPDAENFPQRNRIIAGLVDALIVIESDVKGGAVITANLAFGYNREVYAVPGRLSDSMSQGCNHLIRTNRAQLFSMEELVADLRWEPSGKTDTPVQRTILLDLTAEQRKLVESLRHAPSVSADELASLTGFSPSKVASVLLDLEFEGMVKVLPGSRYALC